MWKLLFLLAVIVAAAVSVEISCDDPNAALPPDGCSVRCDQYCSNFIANSKPICASLQCPPKACGCKNGYYYDKITKMCVLGQDCTKPQPE